MAEYSADEAHRKRRAALNGEPEYQTRCAYCGDVKTSLSCCGEVHFEEQAECPKCGCEVDRCNAHFTGIETTVWMCNNCNWVSDPE